MATTAQGVATGSAVEKLTGLVSADDRFTYTPGDIHQAQIEALNERFQERKDRIKLLGHRAAQAGITEIRTLEDMVPLLFPHTAYKSYPESFLLDERWDRMTKWLGTISPYPPEPIDASQVPDLDAWIDRMGEQDIFISCSSGTTGSPAMLPASPRDMEWSKVDCVNIVAWGTGVQPAQDRRMMGLAPIASVPKNRTITAAQAAAFGDPSKEPFRLPIPPITIGSLTKMVVLRKKMAEGTAMPEEIADFERTSKEREELLEQATIAAAEAMIRYREDKLFISGLWNAQYQVAKLVRDMGYSGKDFNPDNCIYVGGGLKRAQLPADYQEFVYDTFNISAGRDFQNYSMQELNSGMPKCREGRYHVPPWVIPFILNKEGDALVPHDGGEVEGRAAFFDLALDGRWGGLISGDKISLDYRPCACGSPSPSVRNDIVRYADLEGDDKIGCAGTVDAYVRGLS